MGIVPAEYFETATRSVSRFTKSFTLPEATHVVGFSHFISFTLQIHCDRDGEVNTGG